MKREHIPGWLLMAAVGALAMLLSNIVVAGGKHPLEATALAVVIGLIVRNAGAAPAVFHSGIRQFEKPLVWGVILIGATLGPPRPRRLRLHRASGLEQKVLRLSHPHRRNPRNLPLRAGGRPGQRHPQRRGVFEGLIWTPSSSPP